MNNHRLKDSIVELIDNAAGRVGVCAETLDGGWVISIMACDMPQISGHPEIGEDLISTISLGVYKAWAPLYETGELT